MEIIRYRVDDVLRLRKKHPCGGDRFRVARVGSTMRIICLSCGRDMTLPRIKLDKATAAVIPAENSSATHAPPPSDGGDTP